LLAVAFQNGSHSNLLVESWDPNKDKQRYNR
jgi:hypothetical protein